MSWTWNDICVNKNANKNENIDFRAQERKQHENYCITSTKYKRKL